MWDDDVPVWQVRRARRINDKARALRVISWVIDATTQRRYEVLDRQLFDGGFVQQHVLHCHRPRRPIDLAAGLHRR